MQAIRKILQELNSKLSNQNNAFISQPVLYRLDNKLYIAIFASERTKTEPPSIAKPEFFCLTDISTGKLLACKKCDEGSLNGVKVKTTYSVPNVTSVNEDDYDKVYELFDSARQAYIEMPDKENYLVIYAKYMDGIKTLLPTDHIELYEALSIKTKRYNPPTDKEEEKTEKEITTENKEKTESKEKAENKEKIENKEEPDNKEKTTYKWTPEKNLSSSPERMVNVLSAIAKKITILEEDEEKIKYEYPVFCFEEDRKTDMDPWLELQARIINDDIQTGRFKTPKFKSIYMTCTHGKEKCIFGKCPYYAAAYLKKLQMEDGTELERQKKESRKNKEQLTDVNISISDAVDKEMVKKYLPLARSGKISLVKKNEDEVEIEYIESLGPKGCQIIGRTVKKDSLSDMSDVMCDINGNEIPKNIIGAIMAEYADTAPQDKKENVGQTKAEPKAKEAAAQGEENPCVRDTKGADNIPKDNAFSITKVIDKGSLTWRILTNKDIKSFFAMMVEGEREKDEKLLKSVLKLLFDKGCTTIQRIDLSSFPEKADTSVLYVVDVSDTTDAHKLKMFIPDGKIILYGKKPQLDVLSKQHPIREIYAKCILRSEKIDYNAVFLDVIKLLPETLRNECRNVPVQQFINWIKAQSLPLNADGIPAYITWLCVAENRLVFVKPAQPQKQNGGNKN